MVSHGRRGGRRRAGRAERVGSGDGWRLRRRRGRHAESRGSMFKKEKQKEIVGLSLAASDEPVVEVRIEGNKLIPTSQILNEMQTRVGRPYDPALVQRRRPQADRAVPGSSAVDTDIKKVAGRLRGHHQSRRAADDPLHRVLGQRRGIPRHRRHPRQDVGQGDRAQGRRLDRPVRRRGGPPQDHRPLPSQRLQQHAGHHPRGQQGDRQGRGVHHQRGQRPRRFGRWSSRATSSSATADCGRKSSRRSR